MSGNLRVNPAFQKAAGTGVIDCVAPGQRQWQAENPPL